MTPWQAGLADAHLQGVAIAKHIRRYLPVEVPDRDNPMLLLFHVATKQSLNQYDASGEDIFVEHTAITHIIPLTDDTCQIFWAGLSRYVMGSAKDTRDLIEEVRRHV